MAAGVLSEPGSKHGPCAEACEHVDCDGTRNIAEFECHYCEQLIGYERRFYSEHDGDRTRYVHAPCAEDAAA